MTRLILQIIFIGSIVYYGYQYRYRILNVILSNGFLRRALVSSSLGSPMVRDKMMQSLFGSNR